MLEIYGSSDDLIEAHGIAGGGEFSVYNEGSALVACLRIRSESGPGIDVHCLYSGAWTFAVAPESHDGPLPAWPTTRVWGDKEAYSETLRIEVPDGFRLIADLYG